LIDLTFEDDHNIEMMVDKYMAMHQTRICMQAEHNAADVHSPKEGNIQYIAKEPPINKFENVKLISEEVQPVQTITECSLELMQHHQCEYFQRNNNYNHTKTTENSVLNDFQNDLSLKGLRLLVAEDIVEDYPNVLSSLSYRHQIEFQDCPLEIPKSFMVDVDNMIVLVSTGDISTHQKLKYFIKEMTVQALKWKCIWIIVYCTAFKQKNHNNYLPFQKSLIQLSGATGRFPNNIIIRSSFSIDDIIPIIFSICKNIFYDTTSQHKLETEQYMDRPYLTTLFNHNDTSHNYQILTVHSEFLQCFPTINYMMALQILYRLSLKEIANSKADYIYRLLQQIGKSSSNCKGGNDKKNCHPLAPFKAIEGLVTLLHCHIGLEFHENKPITYSQIEDIEREALKNVYEGDSNGSMNLDDSSFDFNAFSTLKVPHDYFTHAHTDATRLIDLQSSRHGISSPLMDRDINNQPIASITSIQMGFFHSQDSDPRFFDFGSSLSPIS
jgi:hypothetical protein